MLLTGHTHQSLGKPNERGPKAPSAHTPGSSPPGGAQCPDQKSMGVEPTHLLGVLQRLPAQLDHAHPTSIHWPPQQRGTQAEAAAPRKQRHGSHHITVENPSPPFPTTPSQRSLSGRSLIAAATVGAVKYAQLLHPFLAVIILHPPRVGLL